PEDNTRRHTRSSPTASAGFGSITAWTGSSSGQPARRWSSWARWSRTWRPSSPRWEMTRRPGSPPTPRRRACSWHRADAAQRTMEALIGRSDEEPESEPALQRVRQAYEELLQKMAVGFGQALQNAGWTVPKTLPQTRIYPDLVEKAGSRVAYFLVDALRFEMGVELKKLLDGSE